jgi:hypothetical protein
MRKQGRGHAIALFEQGEQQMFDIDLLLPLAQGAALSVGKSFFDLLGEFFGIHGHLLGEPPEDGDAGC